MTSSSMFQKISQSSVPVTPWAKFLWIRIVGHGRQCLERHVRHCLVGRDRQCLERHGEQCLDTKLSISFNIQSLASKHN